jgi:type IV pilus assembly protein PilE
MRSVAPVPCNRCALRGFTLVELLLVVTVIGILAGLAYPSYIGQVTKSRRAEAVTVLLEAAARQEQFYGSNKAYSNDMTRLGYSADPADSPQGFYKIDATLAAGGQSYTLVATRVAPQTGDAQCGDLTLTNLGVKSAINQDSSDPAADCW